MVSGPNDQNSDRGIETDQNLCPLIQLACVRTTRIPTEELKRQEIENMLQASHGPNDQNSDRGIETGDADSSGYGVV